MKERTVQSLSLLSCVFMAVSCSQANHDTTRSQQTVPWGIELVGTGAEKLSRDIKIAILDSGVNEKHEDLQGKVVKQYNTLDPDKSVKDEFGHGTAVAGIITASDNDVGVIGVTQSVQLYDVKVLNSEGKGDIAHLISAIEWCIDEQVDIMNISFGFQSQSDELEEVIEQAVSQGMIIVAAAGNTYGLGVDYPAQYEHVLSITSVNEELKRPGSAARGKIDYAAPGKDILSTDHKGSYSISDGTSFATAHATGMIAVLLDEYEGKHQLTDGIHNLQTLISFYEFLSTRTMETEVELNEREYGKGILSLN